MAESTSRGGGRCVGDYVVVKQIGSGSFSVVWLAKHRVHGTEVAIKEIVTGRLNKKLHESLVSEIDILKQINHPNIIRLHDMIEETGRLHLVLEYCSGGDLSMYIQRRLGRVPEATAKHFMQQLAAGLQILRENNLIHRDLKPQNLLLSTNDDNAVLKIADFGFARSLQPRGLAETLCGSPLYMAPEIMQLQKYDAKADLWSVGAILFQLVTGKTPFTGNNQIQLLQNIVKSTELHFPPHKKDLSSDCIDLCRKLLRRNPVERLTFEEFFNHPFLSQRQQDELLRSRRSPRVLDGFALPEINLVTNAEQIPQEDRLPFILDDGSTAPDGSPFFLRSKPSMKSTYGFSLDAAIDRKEAPNTSNNMNFTSKYGTVMHRPENTGFRLDREKPSDGNLKESFKPTDQGPINLCSRVTDSLELDDLDYVLVSGPTMDVSSSSASGSKQSHLPCKLGSTLQASASVSSTSSAPMPIIDGTGSRFGCIGSLDSHSSAPSGISHGSMDIGDALVQPLTDSMNRVQSLLQFASTIRELVNEKIRAGRHLEAFSIEFVILAIWKQALHICHTEAVSAIEGSPSQEMARLRESPNQEHGSPDVANTQRPRDICSLIEREFLLEVANAEELAKVIEPGNMEMPDSMETIYQSALALGRHGAVDEYMGDPENAAVNYTKAVRLLIFLLTEAPSLILNPPFSLTNSDRYRLQSYIDVLQNRQSHSRSSRTAQCQASVFNTTS
ncbi:Serine/threonine-protein kinase ATG1c [Sarracenia purpurea var. burkii]